MDELLYDVCADLDVELAVSVGCDDPDDPDDESVCISDTALDDYLDGGPIDF